MTITVKTVGTYQGQDVTQIRLTNQNNLSAAFLTCGATWQDFLVPRADGSLKNLIIGFDTPEDYYNNPLCACQAIGRVAGRIDAGTYVLNGKSYRLPQNEQGNCLHGGPHGFHKLNWAYETSETDHETAVRFYRQIRSSEDGFAGDMEVSITYCLDDYDRLTVTFTADQVSADTLFNPTNHVYFNLGDRDDLQGQELTIAASHVLETREDLIPTGTLLPVAGTVYDFRAGQELSTAISQSQGFDHAFVLDNHEVQEPVASLVDRVSGDSVTVFSSRNGLVVYTMNELPAGVYFARDAGREAKPFSAVALEAQTLPDAINHNGFGDISLLAGQTRTEQICFAYRRI